MKKITDLSKAQQRVAEMLYQATLRDGGGYFMPMEDWRAYCNANSITMTRVFQAACEGLEIAPGAMLYVTRVEDLSALPEARTRARFVDLHALPGFMLTTGPVRRAYNPYTGEHDWHVG